jgi:hypothetical protein
MGIVGKNVSDGLTLGESVSRRPKAASPAPPDLHHSALSSEIWASIGVWFHSTA